MKKMKAAVLIELVVSHSTQSGPGYWPAGHVHRDHDDHPSAAPKGQVFGRALAHHRASPLA